VSTNLSSKVGLIVKKFGESLEPGAETKKRGQIVLNDRESVHFQWIDLDAKGDKAFGPYHVGQRSGELLLVDGQPLTNNAIVDDEIAVRFSLERSG